MLNRLINIPTLLLLLEKLKKLESWFDKRKSAFAQNAHLYSKIRPHLCFINHSSEPKHLYYMKKIVILLFMLFALKGYPQNTNFQKLLSSFRQLDSYTTIGSYEMSQSVGSYVSNELAWEFLWQKNQYMKPEETFCQSLGWKKLNDNVAIVIFFTGEKDNALAYMISIQTYDLKKGKLIAELRNVGGFGAGGLKPACSLHLGGFGSVKITTNTAAVMEKETVINLDITEKGKIKEAK